MDCFSTVGWLKAIRYARTSSLNRLIGWPDAPSDRLLRSKCTPAAYMALTVSYAIDVLTPSIRTISGPNSCVEMTSRSVHYSPPVPNLMIQFDAFLFYFSSSSNQRARKKDVNFECNEEGTSLHAIDNSYLALVSIKLDATR
jgi:hypothetical protein